MSKKQDTLEIHQIPLGKYLPEDSNGEISEREREIALALANEVLNTALHFYANTKLNGGNVDGEFFQKLGELKEANEMQLRILKCFAENVSRINFMLMPKEVQSAILQDVMNNKVNGIPVSEEQAQEILDVLNSDAEWLDSELEPYFGISTDKNK